MADFDGKVAIVTGASIVGGIGLETARAFAEAGANVVLADLAGTDLEGAAVHVGPEASVAHRPVDISDESSVKALIDFTLERFGRLDVLDNNAGRTAGVLDDGPIESMDVETWDAAFAVNARGTMLMCKHAIPAMAATGGGAIVNIASGTALAGDDFASAYAASKAAVITLTRYVATQAAGKGIRCNAIQPGLIRSAKLESTLPEPVQGIFVAHKLSGRLGEPADIAEVVLFLASQRASFITGQLFVADGGFLVHLPTVPEMRRVMDQMGHHSDA